MVLHFPRSKIYSEPTVIACTSVWIPIGVRRFLESQVPFLRCDLQLEQIRTNLCQIFTVGFLGQYYPDDCFILGASLLYSPTLWQGSHWRFETPPPPAYCLLRILCKKEKGSVQQQSRQNGERKNWVDSKILIRYSKDWSERIFPNNWKPWSNALLILSKFMFLYHIVEHCVVHVVLLKEPQLEP